MSHKKKTMKLFYGLASTVFVSSALTGCSSSSSSVPAPPNIEGCTDWEWDGVNEQWYCDDEYFARQNGVSSGTRVFFYNGHVHTNSHTIKNKLYKTSNSKNKSYKSPSGKIKSGNIGSGTKGGFSTGG